jgi:hypothetical protein
VNVVVATELSTFAMMTPAMLAGIGFLLHKRRKLLAENFVALKMRGPLLSVKQNYLKAGVVAKMYPAYWWSKAPGHDEASRVARSNKGSATGRPFLKVGLRHAVKTVTPSG